MPKILNYNAPWLSRPSPGSMLFSDHSSTAGDVSPKRLTNPTDSKSPQQSTYARPKRLIAHRGSEVFTVVGKQIRWADLTSLKNAWDGTSHTTKTIDQGVSQQHRTLNVSIHQDITQIIASPSGRFLAILTLYTVHVVALPDSSRLNDQDRGPIKLKPYQIGRTAHASESSPVVTLLWHPLAVSTDRQDCFVTITSDAVVRLWEFDRYNTSTMDLPALAVDLKKLIDGKSCDEDFAPSHFGRARGFSADMFDMEVASACFGGQGLAEEDGWASMTLWVAMRTGDVYALCPLLPSRWTPTTTLIPSLSTSVVSKLAMLQDGSINPEQKKAIQQQYQWVHEIDDEEPVVSTPTSESTPPVEIRKRPSNPSPIPKLQGPFDLGLDEEDVDELDVTDIHVIAAAVDAQEAYAFDEEDEDALEQTDAQATIVCLSLVNGKVLICLNLNDVEGQWLPKTNKTGFSVPNTESPEFILLDTIAPTPSSSDVSRDLADNWPLFTPDVVSRFSFFLTTSTTVGYYSLEDWMPRLAGELSEADGDSTDDSGLAFRVKVLCESDIALYEEILRLDQPERQSIPPKERHLSASLIFDSNELGYFLLTSTPTQGYSILFDDPFADDFSQHELLALPPITSGTSAPPEAAPVRPPYEPASAFYKPPASEPLGRMLANIPSRHRPTLRSEIRMSPATLDIMTNTHRALSSQTAVLERSAAELFRRVERLVSETRDAVREMVDAAERIQRLQQDVAGGDDKESIDERLARIGSRQQGLVARYEDLKSKAANGGQRSGQVKELNAKEVAWVDEITEMGRSVGVSDNNNKTESLDEEEKTLNKRYELVQSLASTLLSQVKSLDQSQQQRLHPPPTPQIQKSETSPLVKPNEDGVSAPPSQQENQRPPSRGAGGLPSMPSRAIPSKIQRAKITEAMGLVEREGAVIDGAMRRLEKLSLGL